MVLFSVSLNPYHYNNSKARWWRGQCLTWHLRRNMRTERLFFRREVPETGFMLSYQGAVKITKTVRGNREFTLCVLEPGEVFGEISFLGGINKRTATLPGPVGKTTLGVIDKHVP